MTARALVLLPDLRLRTETQAVTEFGADLTALAGDMFDTMYAAQGRGLAAPQVGVMQRIFVMDAAWKTGAPDPRAFVNPRLADPSDAIAINEEACLSIPDRAVRVARPAEVTLHWQDLDGRAHTARFDGFGAVCVQHETDHLDGRLCIDYPEAPAP